MTDKMHWTADMTRMLRGLRSRRGVNALSFNQIAARMTERFGVPFTKNACIGKAFRLRLRKTRHVKSGRKKRAERIEARAEALAMPTLAPILAKPAPTLRSCYVRGAASKVSRSTSTSCAVAIAGGRSAR